MPTPDKHCHICGKVMKEFKGVHLCLPCNEKYGQYYNFFSTASQEQLDRDDAIIIACPGATIYDESNNRVVLGVQWNDSADFSKGYRIIGRPIYSPNHQKTRKVPRDKMKNISRCQACQDFTVRMRIFNHQKGKETYQQNSPLMPKEAHNLRAPGY